MQWGYRTQGWYPDSFPAVRHYPEAAVPDITVTPVIKGVIETKKKNIETVKNRTILTFKGLKKGFRPLFL
jgi:hypothetical protein